MATLVGGKSYLNPYESIFNSVKNNALFREDDFDFMNRAGKSDMYLGVMMESKNLTPETMNNSYDMFDLMDTDRRVYAISNELDPEAKSRIAKRTISVFDEDKGEYVDKEEEMSDYDYTKYLLDEWSQFTKADIERQTIRDNQIAAQAAKDENVFGNVMGTIASVGLEALEGITSVPSNIGQFFGSLFGAVNESIATGDWNNFDKYYRENMVDGVGRIPIFDQFKDWLAEFETKYSYMRDASGNLTWAGKYIASTFNSLGEMLPSLITGSTAAKLLGKSGKVAGTVGRIAAGTVPYYISMWDQRMYQTFADPKFSSVPTGAIVGQTALASVLDAAVEYGSSKLFGGTMFEHMIFGTPTKASTSAAATTWLSRINRNFLIEGGEEAVQEFTEFFSKFAFSFAYDEFTDEEFGLQNMMDAFLMGGFSSIITNGFEIAITGRNVTVDENGVVHRYSKAKSWNQNITFNDLMQKYMEVLNDKNSTNEQYFNTLKSAYVSMKAFGEIYGTIGQQRVDKAHELLVKFEDFVKSETDIQKTRELYQVSVASLMEDAVGLHGKTWKEYKAETGAKSKDFKSQKKSRKKLKRAIKNTQDIANGKDITQQDILDNLLVVEPTKSKTDLDTNTETTNDTVADKLANRGVISKKGADNVKKVANATGKNVLIAPEVKTVQSNDSMIVIPKEFLDKMTPEEIVRADKEHKLVDTILSALPTQFSKTLVSKFTKYVNKDAVKMLQNDYGYTSVQLAIYYTLFDSDFYNAMLYSSYEDSYKILVAINTILDKSLKTNNVDELIAKNVVDNVKVMMVKNLREYLIAQQTVTDLTGIKVLSNEDVDYITSQRYQKNFYNRFTAPEYITSDSDINHLNMLVNGLTVDKNGMVYTAERKNKLKDSYNKSETIRKAALNEINESYKYVFTSAYNNKIYLKVNGNIANAVFNQFLIYNNYTLNSIKNTDFAKLKSDFRLFSGNNYDVEVADNEAGIKIVNWQTQEQVAAKENYQYDNVETYMTPGEEGFTGFEQIRKNDGNLVRLLNPKQAQSIVAEYTNTGSLSPIEAAYTTMDDVIKNPAHYLKQSVKKEILDDFDKVDSTSTFLYLQDRLNADTGNVTVYLDSNGTYVLADYSAMSNAMFDTDTSIYKDGDNESISTFVKKQYLRDDLADINVTFVSEPTQNYTGYYDGKTDNIIVNLSKKDGTRRSANDIRKTILHELVHAIQTHNNSIVGINTNRITVSDEMIKDFENHLPYIKELETREAKVKAIREFVYYTSSSEAQAIGAEGSGYINFLPTVIGKNKYGTVTFVPYWGTTYYSDGGVESATRSYEQSLEDNDLNIKEMPEEFKSRYVSNTQALNSNLKYFIRKNKPIQMSKEMQTFVKSANKAKIEPGIWRAIFDGTLTRTQVMDYLYNNYLDMNEYTFKLINKSFFGNKEIKSATDLQNLILNSKSVIGIHDIVDELGMDDILSDKRTIKDNIAIIRNFEQNPKTANNVIRMTDKYYNTYNPNDAAFVNLMLEYYDGTLNSLYIIDRKARAGEFYRTKYSGDIKLNETSDEHADNSERIGDNSLSAKDLIVDMPANDYTHNEKVSFVLEYDYANNYGSKLNKWIEDHPNATRNEIAERIKKRQKAILSKGDAWIDAYFNQIREYELVGKKVKKFRDIEEWNNQEPARKSVVAHIKSTATYIANQLNTNEFNKLPDDIKSLYDENRKLKQDVYKDIPTKQLLNTEERLTEIRSEVRSGLYSKNQKQIEQYKERIKKLQEQNEQLKKRKAKKSKIEIHLQDGKRLVATSTTEYPAILVNIMNTAFSQMRQSKVQFVAGRDDRNMVMNAAEFYGTNDRSLSSITDTQASEIVEFFTNLVTIDSTDMDTRRFKAYETYILAYLLEASNNKMLNLTTMEIENINDILKNFATNAGTELAVWRSVLNKIKPVEQVMKAMEIRYGIELTPHQEEALLHAISESDTKSISEIYQDILVEQTKAGTSKAKLKVTDKILKVHKAFMLSNIGTAIRNKISDVILYQGNRFADMIGSLTSKLPGKFKHRDTQYDLTKVKVRDDVASFIKTEFIDSGFIETIGDGMTRYDTLDEQGQKKGKYDRVMDMICNSIRNKLQYGQDVFEGNNKATQLFNKAVNLVFKMQSDDWFINKTAIKYMGKIMTSKEMKLSSDIYVTTTGKNTTISHGFTNEMLDVFAEAYGQATIDYMRKPSVFSKLETTINRWSESAGFVSKLVFPFMSAGWNWFKESLTWTPAGIVKGIQELVFLEKTVDKMEKDPSFGANFQYGSSRFVEMIARRKIGKGVIGTTLLGIGAILAAVGIVRKDDDDTLKLYIGNLAIDLSSITGITSLYIGAALTTIWDSEDNFNNFKLALTNATNLALDDLFIKDFMLTIRYNSADGVVGILRGYAYQILQSFVPNILKALSKTLTVYDVKYASGFLGQLQKYITSWAPGTANLLEKNVDIYTGEPLSKNFGQIMLQLISQLTPLKFNYDMVSEAELEAMSLGINKGQLTGEYEFGELDKVTLNKKYGELNSESLSKIMNDEVKVNVKSEGGKFKLLKYSQMTATQKENAIKTQMQKNSTYAKVYVWTQVEGKKYYASDSEYKELKALGIIKNVYKKTTKLVGFI